MEKLSKYTSMVELIIQNPNLYNYIWQTNDDKKSDKIFKQYTDYSELPNTESELQKYVTTKWKKRPTENTYAIEQMLRTKFSIIYK
jgi:predicted patatin/cPLA2 family phospholipase